ncbi:MAG: hypothetical protein FJW90_07885 [Actinobacteria bacterium]|nr:hypothetical protein [Actinomycetota bacterium]
MRWRVTERHGSEVTKGTFDTLYEAIEHARARVDAALREGRLGTVKLLREFTPDKRVQSRLEISAARLFRGPEAGVDVMGDGAVVAYAGSIRKRVLEADTLDEAFERLREELERGR